MRVRVRVRARVRVGKSGVSLVGPDGLGGGLVWQFGVSGSERMAVSHNVSYSTLGPLRPPAGQARIKVRLDLQFAVCSLQFAISLSLSVEYEMMMLCLDLDLRGESGTSWTVGFR